MPAYDYCCENGHVITETRSIHEESKLTVCSVEDCGSTVLNRIYSNPATVFNGKGFYSTDNRHHLLKPGQQVDY